MQDLLSFTLNRDIGQKDISDIFLDFMSKKTKVFGKDIVGNISGAIVDCISAPKVCVCSKINYQGLKIVDTYSKGFRCIFFRGAEENIKIGDLVDFSFKKTKLKTIVSNINNTYCDVEIFSKKSVKNASKGLYGYVDRKVRYVTDDIVIVSHLGEDLGSTLVLFCLEELSKMNTENIIPVKLFSVLTSDFGGSVFSAVEKIQPLVFISIRSLFLDNKTFPLDSGPVIQYSEVNNKVIVEKALEISKKENIKIQSSYDNYEYFQDSGVRYLTGGIACLNIGVPVYKYGTYYLFSLSTLNQSLSLLKSLSLSIPRIESFV